MGLTNDSVAEHKLQDTMLCGWVDILMVLIFKTARIDVGMRLWIEFTIQHNMIFAADETGL